MNNFKNLQGHEGVEKLKSLAEAIKICLFSTNLKTNEGATSRPMTALEVDEEGNLWFFSGKDSDKNREIEDDKNVQLMFAHPGKSSYMIVNGEAEITVDRQKIEEFWSPLEEIWFKQGKNDPNISLLKVVPKSAYYWDTDGNKMINFFKMVASVVAGKDLVDSEQGTIKV